jgi:hypothetical protein
LEKDEDGIKVYTRLEPGHELKSFKGTTITSASLDKMYDILLDAGNVKDWAFSIVNSEMLEKGEDYFIYYSEYDSPWPVDNRDFEIKAEIVDKSDDTFKIVHRAHSGLKPKKEGVVRINELKIEWSAKKTSNGTELTYQGHSDPGGKIPNWLANSSIVDSPFKSIQGLTKKALEN